MHGTLCSGKMIVTAGKSPFGRGGLAGLGAASASGLVRSVIAWQFLRYQISGFSLRSIFCSASRSIEIASCRRQAGGDYGILDAGDGFQRCVLPCGVGRSVAWNAVCGSARNGQAAEQKSALGLKRSASVPAVAFSRLLRSFTGHNRCRYGRRAIRRPYRDLYGPLRGQFAGVFGSISDWLLTVLWFRHCFLGGGRFCFFSSWHPLLGVIGGEGCEVMVDRGAIKCGSFPFLARIFAGGGHFLHGRSAGAGSGWQAVFRRRPLDGSGMAGRGGKTSNVHQGHGGIAQRRQHRTPSRPFSTRLRRMRGSGGTEVVPKYVGNRIVRLDLQTRPAPLGRRFLKIWGAFSAAWARLSKTGQGVPPNNSLPTDPPCCSGRARSHHCEGAGELRGWEGLQQMGPSGRPLPGAGSMGGTGRLCSPPVAEDPKKSPSRGTGPKGQPSPSDKTLGAGPAQGSRAI